MSSHLEQVFFILWKLSYPKLPLQKEVALIPRRKFRFDFVHTASKTCIEIQGGLYSRGRHTRGKQMEKEYLKWLLAQSLGYTIIPIGTEQVEDGKVLELIAKTIIKREKLLNNASKRVSRQDKRNGVLSSWPGERG